MMDSVKKPATVREIKLVGRFGKIREELLREGYASRLNLPLAYWALPSERQLPLVFLGRTLQELLATPFEELLATPGVGEKKLASLMTLLKRATHKAPPEVSVSGPEEPNDDWQEAPDLFSSADEKFSFDPSVVSEAVWAHWRMTVNTYRFGQQKLGRLAPTLQELPTVIWHTTLDEFSDLSLAEIRQLKTYGEKRVRAVLRVFWVVHKALSGSAVEDHLQAKLVPRFISGLETWIGRVMVSTGPPTVGEIQSSLVHPLLDQLRVDAGPTVWQLAHDRLWLSERSQGVRRQAKGMGITRARVYQLLEECNKVMNVRWPEGQSLLVLLRDKLVDLGVGGLDMQLFDLTTNLFYPRESIALRPDVGRLGVQMQPTLAS